MGVRKYLKKKSGVGFIQYLDFRGREYCNFSGSIIWIKYLIWYFFNWLFELMASISPFGFSTFFHKCRGVKIGKNVHISRHAKIDFTAPMFVEIGDNSEIAAGACILAHNREANIDRFGKAEKTIIKNNVFISVNSVILPGTVIGEGAIIGAGTIVTMKNIPSKTIIVGNPGRIIGEVK